MAASDGRKAEPKDFLSAYLADDYQPTPVLSHEEAPAGFTPTQAEWDYLTNKISHAEFDALQHADFVARYGDEQAMEERRRHNAELCRYATWLHDAGYYAARARH